MPVSYTKAELYTGVTASADITSNISCELRNNGGNTYFSIESSGNTALFGKASFNTLDKCTVVSGSKNAVFAVNGPATASFNLNIGGATIPKENIKFRATNSEVYSIGDSTDSGSYFGIDLTYT